ncbi:hypothetical protein PR002_g26772 [Phytophthora rubi]|uniref:Retrotransposon gag domain-containing protein n=1 Tax=Phytophthora rubi TaxID=129364 RepID=A0A6A3HSC4_9STRA|nr:hypothetical protein PR002_g26772 [Phytophthora rubi]
MKAAKRGEQDGAVCGAGSKRRVGEREVSRGGEQARAEWPAVGWSWSARRSSGQAAECLGWSEDACGGESVRDRYGEEYVNRSWTDSDECDRDDGGIWWFEDGVVGDGLVEYGDYRGDMMKAENNMRELIPYFDSDNASVESAEDFWWCFETATERFDDATRLRMFAARIRGTVGERWRLNSRLTDFETLKRRFYNRFIRLTKVELLQRLFDATQEPDELVDDWGRRIARYCDEARLFKEALRYTAFKNGLRSDRVRKCLDCLPEHSIEVACEWVMAKGLHLPERDGRGVDRRARRDAQEVCRNGARNCGSGVHGESEEDGQEAWIYGLARIVKDMQPETQRRTEALVKYEEVACRWTVREDEVVRGEKAVVGTITSDVRRRRPSARKWVMDNKQSEGSGVSAGATREFGVDIETKGELGYQGVISRFDTEKVDEEDQDEVDPAMQAVLMAHAEYDVATVRAGETVACADESKFVVTECLMNKVMEADSVENNVVAAAPDSDTRTVAEEDHEVVVTVGPFREEIMTRLRGSVQAENVPGKVIESEECASEDRDATETVFESFDLFQFGVSRDDKAVSGESNSDGLVARTVGCVNIDVPLGEGEGLGAAAGDVPHAGFAEPTVMISSEVNSLACKAVCLLLKEEKDEPQVGQEVEKALFGDAGTVDDLPWCDKALVLHWKLVRWLVYCVAEVLGVVDDYWKRIMEWIGNYFKESSAAIWSILWERFKETNFKSSKYRPWRRDWRFVCFDCISLGNDNADVVFVRSEGASEASNYVQVVFPERPPPERDRSQVMVDNDATLSHVGHRLLDRIGRSAKPMKPCDDKGTDATGGFECEYLRNGVPVDVTNAEVKSGAKITKKNGQYVDEVLMESNWNGQVECQHGCGRQEEALDGKLCTLTRNHAGAACCSEVSFGALVGGTLVDDGAVCEGFGEESDDIERFSTATTGFSDHAACIVEEVIGTFDGECFDTVVTVISCDAFPESSEDQAKWATVTYVPLAKRAVNCKDYSAVAGRRSELVSRCELENRSSKGGWADVVAVPMIDSWSGVPPERDKLARQW